MLDAIKENTKLFNWRTQTVWQWENEIPIARLIDRIDRDYYKTKEVELDIETINLMNDSFDCPNLFEFMTHCKLIEDADTIYIDPPYNHRQYNTLYHILEMFAKYSGKLKDCMYKYPEDRYYSPYCYKSQALKAFDNLISEATKKSNHIVFY